MTSIIVPVSDLKLIRSLAENDDTGQIIAVINSILKDCHVKEGTE